MSEIVLTEKTNVRRSSYEPIELENGIVISLESVKNGEKVELRCEAKKGDTGVGTASYLSEANRLFLQVFPVSSLDGGDPLELAATMVECLKEMNK